MTEVKITAEVMEVLDAHVWSMVNECFGGKDAWCEAYDEAITYVMDELNMDDEVRAEKIVKLILKI